MSKRRRSPSSDVGKVIKKQASPITSVLSIKKINALCLIVYKCLPSGDSPLEISEVCNWAESEKSVTDFLVCECKQTHASAIHTGLHYHVLLHTKSLSTNSLWYMNKLRIYIQEPKSNSPATDRQIISQKAKVDWTLTDGMTGYVFCGMYGSVHCKSNLNCKKGGMFDIIDKQHDSVSVET